MDANKCSKSKKRRIRRKLKANQHKMLARNGEPLSKNNENDLQGKIEANLINVVNVTSAKPSEENKVLTDAVALDCEMVGLGPRGCRSSLARVSVVNENGDVLLDKYVKQTEKVTDYRTKYSGIHPWQLKTGEGFNTVQREVKRLITGRKLVGHALINDLRVLLLSHPEELLRDTSLYQGFSKLFHNKTPSLKNLSLQLTGVKIQKGEHCSVEDAWAAMRVYKFKQEEWEEHMKGLQMMLAPTDGNITIMDSNNDHKNRKTKFKRTRTMRRIMNKKMKP